MHAVPWIAIGLLLIRSFLETWIATPIGLHFNISDKNCSHPEKNEILSRAYAKCKNPGEDMLQVLSRELGWTPYKVHKWFWRARQCCRPSQLTKFKESSWRFLVYSCTSVFGLWYLSAEDFFWDRVKCYQDFPLNTPSDTVLLYWALQAAFYVSLLVSHHSDIRRSDYILMLFHHVVTVLLLGMSFVINGVQIGTLILLAHDISDVPLELAKLFKYVKYDRCAQISFGVFAFLFFVARLIIFPFFLLRSVLFEYPVVISHSPAWWIMVILLIILQGMHIYWFILIYQMTRTLLIDSSLEGDIRSEPEYAPPVYEEPNSLPSDSALTPQSSMQSITQQSHSEVQVHRRKMY